MLHRKIDSILWNTQTNTHTHTHTHIWASLIAQLIKNPPVMQETPVQFLGQEDLLEKGWATHSSIVGLPLWLTGKESACNARDLGSISGLGIYPGEGKGYPLQYPGLKNSVDCIVHGVAKNRTRLSNFHFSLSDKLIKYPVTPSLTWPLKMLGGFKQEGI